MNFKTTLVLLVLAAAGGVLFWVGPSVPVWVGLASPVPDRNSTPWKTPCPPTGACTAGTSWAAFRFAVSR